MHTRVKFRADVINASDHYRALQARFSWLSPYDVDQAYELYCNSFNATLKFLVMGRTRVDSARGKVAGSSIEDVDIVNLGGTNHAANSGDFRANFSGNGGQGSVLHYTDGRGWHFLMNDSWLLGGIHAGWEFHAASPRHKNNMVDPIGGFMTVTAREAIGLITFGYQFRRAPLGEIATCIHPEKAKRATLATYVKAIETVDSQPTPGAKEAALNQLGIIDYAAVLTDPSLVRDVGRWNLTVNQARKGGHQFPRW
jgi:hypothetical protein